VSWSARRWGLFLSAVSAGLDIGFSLFLMGAMRTLIKGQLPPPISALLVANMYAVGFIFVVLGRSELFTEHTTLAVLPVLRGRATLASLGRLWVTIYVGNLMGAAGFALLAAWIGPGLGVISPPAFAEIAEPLIRPGWLMVAASGLLAGWLMGLLSWLVTAARDTFSQIFIVWMITISIGFTHLHHSIVGSVEVLAAVFAGQGVTLADYGRFLLWTTIGNAVGGTVFVALIKHTHASRPGNPEVPAAGKSRL